MVSAAISSPLSKYPTQIPIIAESLVSVMEYDPNLIYATLSKDISNFWRSKYCTKVRNSKLLPIFFKKLNIKQDLVSSYIFKQLKRQNMQMDIAYNSLIINHHVLQNFTQAITQDAMSGNIRLAEKQKKWALSYFFAHMQATSRGQDIILENPAKTCFALKHNLPFSSWLIVLQDPEMAHRFICTFVQELPHFDLDEEGMILGAFCFIDIFKKIPVYATKHFITKEACLKGLAHFSQHFEGRTALLKAKGLQFLIQTLNSDSCEWCMAVAGQTKQLIKQTLVDLLTHPAAKTLLQQLSTKKELFPTPDAYQNFLDSLRNISPTPPPKKQPPSVPSIPKTEDAAKSCCRIT